MSVCPVKDRAGHVALIILDFDDPAERLKTKADGGAGGGAEDGGAGSGGAGGGSSGGDGVVVGALGRGKELLEQSSKCELSSVGE